MSGRGRAPLRRVRGLALIVVLWAAALMSLLAASFAFSLRTEARLASGVIERAAAAAAAEAGVQRLMASVASADRREPGVRSGRFSFAGMEVSLRAVPENARIDLNAAPPALLQGLFAHALAQTATQGSAEALAGAVLDWRDADDRPRPGGAESAQYAAAGSPVRPRNAAFLSVDELSGVAGMTPALFAFLRPHLTVYAWSPQVEALSAAPAVLHALPGVTPQQVEAFLAAREEDPADRRALALLAGAGRYLARSGGTVYSLRARARAPSGVIAERRAVVKLEARADRAPMAVLAWLHMAVLAWLHDVSGAPSPALPRAPGAGDAGAEP